MNEDGSVWMWASFLVESAPIKEFFQRPSFEVTLGARPIAVCQPWDLSRTEPASTIHVEPT